MSGAIKRFEEKKQEELQRVEERFDALLKYGDAEAKPTHEEEKVEKKEEEEEEEGEKEEEAWFR